MTELSDFVGGWVYSKDSDPRWQRITGTSTDENGAVITTEPENHYAVPREIREQAYREYDGKRVMFEPTDPGAEI